MDCLQKKEKELYTCSFCEKTFEFKPVFLRHQKTHTNDILIPSFIYQNKIYNTAIIQLMILDMKQFLNTNRTQLMILAKILPLKMKI